jgi:hypothetical protein
LGGRNPIGRYLRYVGDPPQPWYQIVGVVKDLGTIHDDPYNATGVYHPLTPETAPLRMAVQLRGDPVLFIPQLRVAAAAVDPALRLHDIARLDAVGSSLWLEFNFLFKVLIGICAIALTLSLAGIYAVTSFTVARRTREIGIRVALGGEGPRVVRAIFARPLTQVGMGVMAGGLMTGAFAYGVMRGSLGVLGIVVVGGYATLMMAVCLLACLMPTVRALRIQPTEALKSTQA